jgi:hypothetical protein
MHPLDKTAWEILNATADDWESLEQIYHLVCFDFSPEQYESRDHGAYYLRPAQGAASLEEIAERITNLVEAGFLEVRPGESGPLASNLSDRSYVWRAWFRMTPSGRSAWESSQHFVEQD